MSFKAIFTKVIQELEGVQNKGKVANYIPELGNVDPSKFGVHLTTINNQNYNSGDSSEKFSIQSISKVLSVSLAYHFEGKKLWKRVGIEPSGTPFNSLVQLEADNGIPRNPLINAGALVICDVLIDHLDDPKSEFLEFVRTISGTSTINYCKRVSESEKSKGFRNASLINLMKDYGNINNDIDVVLDLYFNLCSIEMTCKELSKTFLYLANNGVCPNSKTIILSPSSTKKINAIMQLCGFYDEAGEFSFKVGLPGKSGVGGGIIAIHPGEYSIAVWSPKLNKKGNSFMGIEFLERLTTETQESIF